MEHAYAAHQHQDDGQPKQERCIDTFGHTKLE